MTKPRLRRWHFDLALLAGLLLFGISYRCILPSPKWTSRVPSDPIVGMDVRNLGFSSDNQFFYTIKDNCIVGSRLPKPTIQRWNTQTGEFLEEYPLQMPAEDIAFFKPTGPGTVYYCFEAHQLGNRGVILTRQNTNYRSNERVFRLYDMATGQCLTGSSPLILKTDFRYLLQNPGDGHHWACYSLTFEPNEPAQVVDLSDGKTIHTIPAEKNKNMQAAYCSTDQKHIIIVWTASLTERTLIPPVLTIHSIDTWECIHRLTLPVQPNGMTQFDQMDEDHFAIKHMVRNGEVTQLITTRYRYNLLSKTFEQEGQPLAEPWNGNDVTWNQRPFRIHRQIINDNRQLTEPFLTIDNYLKRFGLTIWRRPYIEQQLYVFDHESGKPLRQLTGITEFGNANTLVSPSGQFLAGVKPNEEHSWIKGYNLILYEIPHHLWERSLRAIMYLSWLLILPWPFRYLIRSAR